MWAFSVSVSFVLGIFVSSLLWNREIRIGKAPPPRPVDGRYPFRKVEAVLAESEMQIFRTIQHEVGESRLVLAKVRLADALTIPKGVDRRDFLLNLAGGKRIDFLVCDAQSLAPLVSIQMLARNEDDNNELVSEIHASAGMPFLQLPNKKAFEPGELAELIREAVRDAKSRRVG